MPFKKQRLYKSSGKKEYLERYYDKHKKKIDDAIDSFRRRNPGVLTGSNKKIFVDDLYLGKDFNSKRNANLQIERTIYGYKHAKNNSDRAYLEAAYEVKQKAKILENTPEKYKNMDTRKLRSRISDELIDYEFKDEDTKIFGYYKVKWERDYVLVRQLKYHRADEKSPEEQVVWRRKDEIDL